MRFLDHVFDWYLRMVFALYASEPIQDNMDEDNKRKTKILTLFCVAGLANIGSLVAIAGSTLVDGIAAHRNPILVATGLCAVTWALWVQRMLETYKARYGTDVVLLGWYRRYYLSAVLYLIGSGVLAVGLFACRVVRRQ
jgi:hypothetical protein